MKERPIIFSAPMVRAILDGRKTQTRRIVKPVPGYEHHNVCRPDLAADQHAVWWHGEFETVGCMQQCPYGQPGTKLWVREAWRHTASDLDKARRITQDIMSGTAVDYRATYIQTCMRELGFTQADAEMADDFETWRPSIHMPRWASRITLEVESVRVERLQDISEADAKAEGAPCVSYLDALQLPVVPMGGGRAGFPTQGHAYGFQTLWESINGPGSWDANPWTWVIGFRRLP